MEQTRRRFLSLIGAFGAEAVLDPERLLWRRGAKLISIPKPVQAPQFKTFSQLFDELADAAGYTWSVHPDPIMFVGESQKFLTIIPTSVSDVSSL